MVNILVGRKLLSTCALGYLQFELKVCGAFFIMLFKNPGRAKINVKVCYVINSSSSTHSESKN